MKRNFFLLLTFFFFNFIYGQYKVKFEVKQPNAIHSADQIFIAGGFNNWDRSIKENGFSLDKNGTGKFEIQLPAGNYEYKFTRGSWDKGECLADGKDAPNRILALQNDTTIYISIAGWRDDFYREVFIKKHTSSANVKIIDSAFKIPQLNRQRRIWIYLPPDYKSGKNYPVIYMHDGQNLFDEATAGFGEWGIDEYLDSIFTKGKKKSIIVGIDNSSSKRMNEYNPYYFKQFGKGEGNAYVDFIVKTLKPYIDKSFHTLPGKSNTFIAGSSMGGLISLYAVLKYPSVFGGAGIFSPAFWTANGIDKDLKLLSPKVNSKLFFYAGGKESEKMLPDMKRIEAKIKVVSRSPVKEIIDPGAKHNEAAWRKYFPDFYQWILGIK